MTTSSRGSRILFALVGAAGLAMVAVSSAAAAAKIIKLEAPDFEVISDASAQDVRQFATGYAAYRKVFSELLLPEGRHLPRSHIVLLRRQRDFAELLDTEPKRAANTRLASYQGEVDDAVLTATAVDGDREKALRLIYEFDTLWALRRLGYGLPIWATQGTGEVLASLTWKRDAITFGDTSIGFDSQLTRTRMLPWERFFEVNIASPEYTDRNGDRIFHAQAWLMMHYVLFGGETWQDGRARFTQLADAMAQHSDDVTAVESAFDLSPGEFDETIRRYRRKYPKPAKLPFDEEAMLATAKLGPAREVEWFVALADLAAMVRKDHEHYIYLEKARASEPNAIELHEALGRQAWRKGDRATANDHYQAAIAAGTTNATTYLRSASYRLDRAGFSLRLTPGGMSAHFARPARTEIERALELSPNYEEAWATLGRILIVAADTTTADATLLDAAVDQQLRGQQFRYLRALLRDRVGDVTGARADLRRVVLDGSADSRLREQAREVLFRSTVTAVAEQVQKLAGGKNFAAARITLDEARKAIAEIPDLDPSGNLDRLQGWLDQNEALDQLNAHNIAGRWQSLLVGAEDFVARFPQSPLLPKIKDMADLARRKGAVSDL